jgi:multiple sugar transport system permease protein
MPQRGSGFGRRGGVAFTLPVTLFLITFIAFPLVFNVQLSVLSEGRYVGSRYLRAVFGDASMWDSLRITVIYVTGSVLFQILLGTAVGIALDQEFAGRAAARSITLIPWVIPGAVAATTWAWMYHGDFGIVSRLLIDLGVDEARRGLLTLPSTVLGALILVNVWKMFPFVAVMVLAGLQGIDRNLYEAARVDGASFGQEVRLITLPNLRHVLLSVLLLLTIWGVNSITLVFTMTGGGPADLSLILPLHVYRMGFQFFNFNAAAVESLFLFVILAVLIAVYLRLFAEREGSSR